MADITGATTISLNGVLYNDVQEVLKNKAIFANSIRNVSDRVIQGMTTVDLPRIEGGSAGVWPVAGAEATTGGVAIAVDVLSLDQFKQYSTFVYDADRVNSPADLDDYFAEVSPSKLADLIEVSIYTQLKAASAAAPDNILKLSGTGTGGVNTVLTVADIFAGAEAMDTLNIPMEGRKIAMGTESYYALLQEDAIINGSKSLSNEALVNGTFAKIAGFELQYSGNVPTAEAVAYYTESAAFAFGAQGAVTFEKERQVSKKRDFLILAANYGSKVLDAGERTILFNATGA